jgi:hypothetical protein
VTEALGMVYKCHYPGYAMQTARGVKHSPIHQRLKEHRAYFRDVRCVDGLALILFVVYSSCEFAAFDFVRNGVYFLFFFFQSGLHQYSHVQWMGVSQVVCTRGHRAYCVTAVVGP